MTYWHSLRNDFQHLAEFEKLLASIREVVKSKDQIAEESLLGKCRLIIDQYQEQPNLLDPHLESLLGQLLAYVQNDNSEPDVMHFAFKIMYFLTKTRGYKVIVRLLPHEVSDMEPVLALLGNESTMQGNNWASRYMLFLWLSIICMNPFDMVKLDNTSAGNQKKPIMERVIEVGKQYLDVSDKTMDAAGYMLSKFMTRPDVKTSKLAGFIDWSMQGLHDADLTLIGGQRKAIGILSTLAMLCKHSKREDVYPFAPMMLEKVLSLQLKFFYDGNLRKLNMKIIQRIGLVFLKARVASWRYQRGSRSLFDNINNPAQEKPTNDSNKDSSGLTEQDEDYEIADEVEDVIEHLLNGLRDENTVVRWSAAKGIGRVTGRLPLELADEVVTSVLDLFTPAETDKAWHGGCLALAELGRRGLLLPEKLSQVAPVIVKSLNFDEKRGHFSVGSNVRDAACFLCWACARAYEPSDLKPYVEDIARALVIASVLDREFLVRGAAAAAFQENVGRQGQFPHGIDIITTCDIFAVFQLKKCYLELSHFVGGFPEYTIALMDHLCKFKSSHWDENIRDLSAQAMNKLVAFSPEYVATDLLPGMLENTMSVDLNVRHGAVLLTAWVLVALSDVESKGICSTQLIGKECIEHIKGLVQKYREAKYFQGISGDLMMKVVCCLIEKVSLAKLPLKDDPVIEVWQKHINECLEHIGPEVRNAGVAAIPSFFTAYYQQEGGTADVHCQENIIETYLKEMKSENEIKRMGYTLAVGALPKFFVQGYVQGVCSALIEASKIQKMFVKFADARRDAVIALARLCSTVGINEGCSGETIDSAMIPMLYDGLFKALNDYTLDSRGDVGALVREASMSGLKVLTSLIVKKDPDLLQAEWCREIFTNLVQQACEKIDRTRGIAGETLVSLLHHEPQVPHVLNRKELEGIIPKDTAVDINWSVPSVTFPLFVQLLSLPAYAYHVMLGVTISVGGLTESLVHNSGSSLTSYVSQNYRDEESFKEFGALLLKVCNEYIKQDRVMIPMMKMLDLLLANGSFAPIADTEDPELAVALLDVCKREISQCGDPQKLLAAIDVFCGLLQFKGGIRNRIISQLLIFMCYKFPKVRKSAAEKFYETALLYDDIIDESKVEEVMSVLTETVWDAPVDKVRPIRNKLCETLGLPVPAVKKTMKKNIK